jgi:hypothetical protein
LDNKKKDKTEYFNTLYSLQFSKSSPEYSEYLLTRMVEMLSKDEIKSIDQGWPFLISVCKDVLKWTSSKHRTLIKSKIFKVVSSSLDCGRYFVEV